MCRWLAYSGPRILLSSLILAPENSLIRQSRAALQGASSTNGDGFGIGWYAVTDTLATSAAAIRLLSALAATRTPTGVPPPIMPSAGGRARPAARLKVYTVPGGTRPRGRVEGGAAARLAVWRGIRLWWSDEGKLGTML